VAAFGQNVLVVASGKSEVCSDVSAAAIIHILYSICRLFHSLRNALWQAVSGTSCSAPILAGLVASINDELLKAGKQPLGFLNPWLYANPQVRCLSGIGAMIVFFFTT